MDAETLQGIIENHKLWLEGKGGIRADLRGADLRDADLSEAILIGADLRHADLRGAILSWAKLSGADLRKADLRKAGLIRADLSGADLRGAKLSWAKLIGTDLSGADLRGAHLHKAKLNGADLRGAKLDFSVLPLWYGGMRFKIDGRIAAQLMYHICSMKCDDPEFIDIQNKVLAYANRSHLVKLYGELMPVEAASKEEKAER